jgi:fructoselysine-6-P-deglycase FrlB-like protein
VTGVETCALPICGDPGLLAFPLPALPDALRAVLEVVPIQLLAYGLAQAQGYAPGQVRYITKVIRNEAGIPNQS